MTEAVAEIAAVAAEGVTVQYAVCDVTVEDDVRAAAVAPRAAPTGALDVLFACAGGSLHLGPIVDADVDAWKATLDLNVVGTFLSIKHAAARCSDRRWLDHRDVFDRRRVDAPAHECVLRRQSRHRDAREGRGRRAR